MNRYLDPSFIQYIFRYKHIACLFTSFFLLFSQNVVSAPLGLPKNTAKIGYGIGGAHISVDDPDGDTQGKWDVQPLTLVYSDWLVSGYRHWSEVYFYQTSLDPTSTSVGQDVERVGLRFSLQKNIRLNKSFAPWIGGGLDVSRVDYSVRHTKDSDGFLIESFDDRNENAVSLILNVMNEWTIQSDWSIAAKLEQSVAIQSDISDFLATVNLLFRY